MTKFYSKNLLYYQNKSYLISYISYFYKMKQELVEIMVEDDF
jgi:hypothetical protein